MKRAILFLLPFAYACTALACPNLSGTFECRNEEKTEHFKMHVTQNADHIQWTINGDDLQGPFPFKSTVQNNFLGNVLNYHATCEGESVTLSGVSQTVPQTTAIKLTMKKTAEGLEIDHKNPLGYETGSCTKVEL